MPEAVFGAVVETATQRRADQVGGLRAGQLADVEPVGDAVLPHREDRVGHGHPVRRDRDHEGGAGRGELVHQGRGQVVEQMRVVEAEHQPPPLGRAGKVAGDLVEPVRAVGRAVGSAGQQVGERAERDRRRRRHAGHPVRPRATFGQLGEQDLREPGLARAGPAGEQEPADLRVGQRPAGERQLLFAADQGPFVHHAKRLPTPSHTRLRIMTTDKPFKYREPGGILVLIGVRFDNQTIRTASCHYFAQSSPFA